MLSGVFSGAFIALLSGYFHRALQYGIRLLQGARGGAQSPSAWLAGATLRWHTHPRLAVTRDRVDAHSARVAILILQLCPGASAALLAAAVIHDLGEAMVGDMSAPVKRKYPDLYAVISGLEAQAIRDLGLDAPDLSERERAFLKLCDGLDSYLWALLHCPDLVAVHPAWRAHLARLVVRADELGVRSKFNEILAGVSGGKF